MPTPVSDFFYDLPKERIAQTPAIPRDSSRLLTLSRKTGEIAHLDRFSSILSQFRAGDVLVFNVSKVFRARIFVNNIEILVLSIRDGEIDALARGSKKLHVGDVFETWIVLKKTNDGIVTFQTHLLSQEMFEFCEKHGEVPLPPYIAPDHAFDEQYQTVYAKTLGSVAAPTAGLHFTPELLEKIRARGVQIEEITLHVGIGTFRPVQTSTIEAHEMHPEFVHISKETSERILQAKREGRRIIAVGTTTVRALEGAALYRQNTLEYSGFLNIFMTPPFEFRVVDALVTNFHLPQSTLLMLVCAFASKEHVFQAYSEAIRLKYRFFSFGDAMLIF